MKDEFTAAVLETLVKAEREAAELIMHAHGILASCKSGRRDVVTEYDKKVQALLTERISAAVPGAKFFCEENMQQDDLDGERVFIIDPIDGTMNFVQGLNHSCISIAYRASGELKAAAIYNPYMDEMFTALKGEGAYLNGKSIHVSEGSLSESLVCCGTSPYNSALAERGFELMKQAFLASLDIRRQGSCALDLCTVAAGRAGAFFELSVSLWDYAAGVLLVQEAGGVCTDTEGRPLPFDGSKSGIVCGGERAAAELLKITESR